MIPVEKNLEFIRRTCLDCFAKFKKADDQIN